MARLPQDWSYGLFMALASFPQEDSGTGPGEEGDTQVGDPSKEGFPPDFKFNREEMNER